MADEVSKAGIRDEASYRRSKGPRTGVYKSLAALGEIVEKAKRIGAGTGGVKVSRRQYRDWMQGAQTIWVGGSKRPAGNKGGGLHAPRHQIARTVRNAGRPKSNAPLHKAKAKTLYVYRPVENAADIIAWAKSQGFATTLAPEDLHVTLAHSKTPLNWAMLHDDYHFEPSTEQSACCGPVLRSADGGNSKRRIKGGVREVKALGAEGAILLAFESDTLTRRWMDFKAAGAVWSFAGFQPHITLTYDGKGVDLDKVHPYAGDIVLGEECWEEVREGGQEAAIARQVTKTLGAFDERLGAVEKKLETAD